MHLRAVDEDVADAVKRQPEQRERAMLGARETQRQAAQPAPGGDEQRRKEKAVADADFGRHRGELERDREPGGAPDRDAGGEDRYGFHGVPAKRSAP